MSFSPAAVTKYLVTGERADHRQQGPEVLGRQALRRPPACVSAPPILVGPIRARPPATTKPVFAFLTLDGSLAPKSAACTDNTRSFRHK